MDELIKGDLIIYEDENDKIEIEAFLYDETIWLPLWKYCAEVAQRKNEENETDKGTSFKNLTKEEVKRIEKWINNYPRKIFKFKTSEEYYAEEMKVA